MRPQGAQKAAVCGACHGMTGNSVNPEWPSLAGQHESYIVAQLKQFKQGARVNPLMTPMAAMLSEADMQDLGAHFAQQTPTGLEADPSNWKSRREALSGRRCGPGHPGLHRLSRAAGQGQRPGTIPGTSCPARGLRLQPAHGIRGRQRARRPATTSCRSSPNLTDEEMRALASYLQGLR